ncbi:hypothetical protein PINS_up000819 [Pythium insidiosum]|nr:hypothetical protein PINS_up000819 [Pythium insidiosum]
MSKSISVLLPAAFVCIDALLWLPCVTATWSSSLRLKPVICRYLMGKWLVLLLLIAFVANTVHNNRDGASEHADTITLSLSERLLKALLLPLWTLRKCVWPARLQMHYPVATGELDVSQDPECLLSVTALLLFGGWVATSPQWIGRRHLVVLSAAYAFVMLLPVSGLIQHGLIMFSADRYTYYPLMAGVPWAAVAIARALETPPHFINQQMPTASRRSCLVTVAVVIAVCVHVSRLQMEHWRDSPAMLDYSLRCVAGFVVLPLSVAGAADCQSLCSYSLTLLSASA